MTIAGKARLSEALRSFGRSFFELADAVEKLDDPGIGDAIMQKMGKEVVRNPVKTNGRVSVNP